MKHDFLDHHREGNSLIHRLDPRLKIVMIVFFILIVLTINYENRYWFLLYFVVPLLLAILSEISLLHYLIKLLRLYPMIFFVTLLIPLFPLPDETPYRFWGISISSIGLQKFILINTKAVLILFISIVLTSTTDFMRLLKGLEKFRIPTLVLAILSFMYRFIFLLIDEMERVVMAYRSRYLHLSLMKKIKVFASMIGLFFIRTYERGERIYLAMESRGFQGNIYTLTDLRWRMSDSLVAVIFFLTVLVPFISMLLKSF